MSAISATNAELQAPQAALAAEHAAVYGYGVAGAILSGAEQAMARSDWTAHQEARDTLQAMITKLGATPVAASAAYELPFTVHDARSARLLAAVLKDGVAQAYLGIVAVPDGTLRAGLRLAPVQSRPRGSASTRAMAVAAASRSSAIEIRSAHDHQNQQRPSLPRLT
jgi:hypothetical protein